MNLNPIASNMTELELRDGTRVLFSYSTPVACVRITENGKVFSRTTTKWSATTTKHIGKWVSYLSEIVEWDMKSQEFFDNLVK